MLSRVNSMVWMDGNKETVDETTASWAQNNNGGVLVENNKEEMEMTFKSMLDAETDDWSNMHVVHPEISFSPGFAEATDNNNNSNSNNNNGISIANTSATNQLLLQPVDSTSSCSPTIFNSQLNYFMQPRSFLNANPLEGSFDLGCESGYLESAFTNRSGILSGGFGDIGTSNPSLNLSSTLQFQNTSNLITQGSSGFGGFSGFGESSMQVNSSPISRSKILKPLDNFTTTIGSPPTLFQKRAALKKNLGNGLGTLDLSGGSGVGGVSRPISLKSPVSASNERFFDKGFNDKKRKSSSGDDIDDLSIDGSNLNYDSDELFLENGKLEESGKNVGSSAGTGDDKKGKKKGLPAKNLMAERRRRKKLNDRLYMLRSVVPKISKMDRASILGDAIEYLKELLQKINDLHNELESIPSSSSLTPTAGLYPLTPTTPGFSARIKEELCPSAFASPLSSPTGQPARVEVRLREGRAVNVHMFCGRRPGLLLSTMRAMDNLGLDVQQAVISCFNGFALDVFRAEQCRDGQELNPDQIKAVLLDSAGYGGMV